jgi:hypothetical protein
MKKAASCRPLGLHRRGSGPRERAARLGPHLRLAKSRIGRTVGFSVVGQLDARPISLSFFAYPDLNCPITSYFMDSFRGANLDGLADLIEQAYS